jgi:Ca2+-transporting ATPase
MNYAVISSLALLLLVIYLPFFNTIFNTVPLGWTEWKLILPLLIVPSIAAEIAKYFVTWQQTQAKKANAVS